jgi:DNA (cytosine-5)-methyltransferase 1
MQKMTFGSLFSGIGGFDLGLERAGMECRWQVEIDDYATRVLAKHWPHVTRWGDIRTFPLGQPSDWHVDLICAGVPCQPVSIAGRKKGASDERWMWGEALRVVADLQPRFFVAENPVGILSHDGGRTFRGLLRALASVGYVCEWHVIAAADVGAPHLRQRVWLVAYAKSVCRWARFCQAAQIENRNEPRDCSAALADAHGEGLQRSVLEHTGSGLSRPRSGARRDEKQDVPEATAGWWSIEPDVGRVAHGIPSRVDRLRCLGNAVVPQVVEVIGRAIISCEGQVRA